jgi:hypothetical protein
MGFGECMNWDTIGNMVLGFVMFCFLGACATYFLCIGVEILFETCKEAKDGAYGAVIIGFLILLCFLVFPILLLIGVWEVIWEILGFALIFW